MHFQGNKPLRNSVCIGQGLSWQDMPKQMCFVQNTEWVGRCHLGQIQALSAIQDRACVSSLPMTATMVSILLLFFKALHTRLTTLVLPQSTTGALTGGSGDGG